MRSLLERCVGLFPRAFREQYELELTEHLDEDYARARVRGWLPLIGFTIATAFDLVRSAIAERWRPTWTRPPIASKEKTNMRSLLDNW